MNRLSQYMSRIPTTVYVFMTLLVVSGLPSMSQVANHHPGKRHPGTSRGESRIHTPIWSKSVKVPYRSWIPVDKPHQVLLCVHGLGFSSKSFSEFGRSMAGRGFAVYALDVRGFGQWMQRQNDKVDFEGCMSDVEASLRALHKAYPGVPVVLIGPNRLGFLSAEISAD